MGHMTKPGGKERRRGWELEEKETIKGRLGKTVRGKVQGKKCNTHMCAPSAICQFSAFGILIKIVLVSVINVIRKGSVPSPRQFLAVKSLSLVTRGHADKSMWLTNKTPYGA